ncbi:hypothetical protein J2128_002169 [Methanomicrobium sp. W14]|uniref:hypothetical protein n=1 Tax=Methanomicrobium sp. W14 TaxID=2817839 RepID=UPI001FD9A9B6|nr:hypothetical protein [Methanomicrobium sp. W14]MBP2134203.1 hypothetical protein [Methanomicrobium sp. W14]
MTEGEFWEQVFPEEYAMLKENLTAEEFENFSAMKKYWGDDHPELPYGANVWDENGPVSLRSIKNGETSIYGLKNQNIDKSGYVIKGANQDAEFTVNRLCLLLGRKSGIVLCADNLRRKGSSIVYSGTGRVAGYTSSTELTVTIELYGDGTRVGYDVNYGNKGHTVTVSNSYSNPQSGTLYQSKVIGTSTNPDLTTYTWSPGRLWPYN